MLTTGPEFMEAGSVTLLAARRARDVVWVDDAGARTWAELGAAIEAAAQQCRSVGVESGELVVTPGAAEFESLAWLFGAALAGAIVVPLRPEREGEIKAWTQECAISWQVRDGQIEARREGAMTAAAERLLSELRVRGHPGLLLGTGGTTGRPKLVLHDLTALLATVPIRAGRPGRILPLMKFDHIGGLDIAWRALAGGQTLVAPPKDITPDAVAAAIARHAVAVLPATPSFLNLLLLAGAERIHDLHSLRVVPYGAEPMPAGLLERLRAAFPIVEFLPRFGTSETGVLPVRAAGDALLLPATAGDFGWKVVEGELWVRSPARALGYLSGSPGGFAEAGWYRTGDLAEQRPDGSMVLLGRRSDLINVGGEKVLPGGVEAALLTHPLVADCRVFPLSNPVLGQVVAAEVVWRGPERDAVAVKRLLHQTLSSSLPNCHLPAVVRLVTAIYTSGNLKKIRSVE